MEWNAEKQTIRVWKFGLSLLSNTANSKSKIRSWLLGFAAVGAVILAAPAAALACVSASMCTGAGGTPETGKAGTLCSNPGGAYDQVPICSGGSTGTGTGTGTSTGPGKNYTPFLTNSLPWVTSPSVPPPFWSANPVENPFAIPFQWMGVPVHAPDELGGPVQFSAYGSNNSIEPGVGGDVFGIHNTGYRVSDSAGAIAPGSLAPGYSSLGYGGGANLTFDSSRFINFDVNDSQHLTLGLSFDYQNLFTTYGTSALTPGVTSAGSVRNDIYTVTAFAAYNRDAFYLSGWATYDWGQSGITNALDGGTGNTNGQAYNLGATGGYLFPLFNNTGVSPSPMPTKVPPVPRYGSFATFLDLDGRVGYVNGWANGYTDSAGFIFGAQQVSYTDVSVGAKLVTVVPTPALLWIPFIGVRFDQQLGFRNTFDIPAQGAIAADTLFFNQSTSFWTAQAGLNIISRDNIQVGVTGFYSTSADTSVYGGNVFVKIPFYLPPSGDSGIRAASK
jgi:hypothetical protein